MNEKLQGNKHKRDEETKDNQEHVQDVDQEKDC